MRTSTARTLVSAARNLRDLPAVHRVADEGRLSFDQLAPIARIATPETDAHWATTGPGCAPATLDAIASGRRAVSTDEANERHRQRSLRWWRDGRIGMWRFAARLPDDLGAIVITALERAYAQQQPNADGLRDPGDVRAADARRLVCDGTLQLLVKDALGNPVGLSARRRTVSPALGRVLRHRDRRCRFPGCERSRGVQAHHIEHAADGGPTEASNLVRLCPFHHRFLHEGRWRIEGDPAKPDGLVFRRPDGRVFTGHGPQSIRRSGPASSTSPDAAARPDGRVTSP